MRTWWAFAGWAADMAACAGWKSTAACGVNPNLRAASTPAFAVRAVIALVVITGYSGMNPWLILPATVILFREVFVSGLREFLGADAGKLKVTKLAKWKTTAQMVAIAMMFLGTGLDYYEKGHAPLVGEGRLPWSDDWSDLATQIGMVMIWAAAILTAITGWDYFDKARPFLRDPDAA